MFRPILLLTLQLLALHCCFGKHFEDRLAECQRGEDIACLNNEVFIKREGKCVDVTVFTCSKNQQKIIEYHPDPYLCNVYHMCHKGTKVATICCSKGEVFSPEAKTCVQRPAEALKCKSDKCAALFTTQVCNAKIPIEPRLDYPTAQCPVA